MKRMMLCVISGLLIGLSVAAEETSLLEQKRPVPKLASEEGLADLGTGSEGYEARLREESVSAQIVDSQLFYNEGIRMGEIWLKAPENMKKHITPTVAYVQQHYKSLEGSIGAPIGQKYMEGVNEGSQQKFKWPVKD